VIARLHADIAAIMRAPTLVSRLSDQGFDFVDLGPAELRSLMERDWPRWLEIIALAGLKR
jgi:tripartite-type tricarboxylate transporter receptor subunit TctC